MAFTWLTGFTVDGNVGIGTDSPDAQLDIGVNNIITLDDTGSSTGFIGLGSYNNGTINRAQGQSYYGFGLEIDRPNELISFKSYASTGATNSGVGILTLKRDGNVGIGTDGPTANLYVSGSNADATDKPTMRSESVFTIKPVALNSGNLNFAQVDGGNSIGMQYTNGAGTADWDISMQPFGGNVGIGVTNPASKLTVGGTASGFSTAMQVWQDGETAASGDIGGKAATFFGESGVSNSSIVNIYSTNGYTGQNGGEIGFGGKYASDASVAQFAKIRSFKTNASNGGTNYGGGLEFWTRPNGSAAVPRITILGDGDVGIGTNSPTKKLEIATPVSSISGSSTDEGAVLRLSSFINYENGYSGEAFIGGLEFYTGDSSGSGPQVFGAIKQRQLTYYNTQAMCFFTAPYNGSLTERMRISDDGAIKFNAYGAGTLVTDDSGNITAVVDPPVDGITFNNGATITNQINTDVDTGTETIAIVATATHDSAFFDFVIKKTTNVRSGTVYACHDGTSVVFTETSTNDLGDTSDVTLSVDISGTNMRLLATVTSDDWSVKSLIRAI